MIVAWIETNEGCADYPSSIVKAHYVFGISTGAHPMIVDQMRIVVFEALCISKLGLAIRIMALD